MAEHDQDNDEYQFAELDSLGNESFDESGLTQGSPMSSTQEQTADKKNIKRNALIAVALVVLAMVLYKFIGYLFFSGTSESVPTKAVVPPMTQMTQTQTAPVITPAPVQPIQQVQQIDTQAQRELSDKISALEASQRSLRADLSALNEQIGTINNNVNNLNSQIANLSQTMNVLSSQMAKQSEVVGVLIARTAPKKPKPVVRYTPQRINYAIQAVIPGRAWLIGSNGSTITVREGTKIAGYGMVKLIDSIQGRVLTSSGQVIKFSQDDS
ncbi:type IVB secretion system protein IcmG/DotF [Legionella worsleiensis]|uniref:Protein IcmG (DotF) n=2 Tax=Legionella worsleiensis TaxID=45076 RepID=A0A0W1AK71_9GAMM|nr:protein IcmG (DotF) [Legionella worsleiensis]STY31869.1 protein IcmG (DotF) [Legionella worsleiensis]